MIPLAKTTGARPATSPSLVVFGEDWGRHPSSTQHLVARIAADHDVLWINSIGLRRPRLGGGDLKRVATKLAGWVRPEPSYPVATPERLSVVSPRAVSWPGSGMVDAVNRVVLAGQVRARLHERGMARPILWTSLPTVAPLVGMLGECALIYYVGDDFGALTGVDHAPVSAMERTLAERADVVIAASNVIANRFPAAKTLVVPHGVDLDLFSAPAPRPADLPVGRPIAGFYGSLSDWIDVALVAEAARRLPHWDFVLIGPVRTNVTALRSLANVRLLGPKPHGALAAYAQHWSVSMLPFRDTPQIHASNPLKLREYLAVGSPIVTAPFPALEAYRPLVTVCPYGGDWAAALLEAEKDGHRNAERRRAVAGESWDVRADQIRILVQRLAR